MSEICYLPLDTLENRTPPDPSRRKGIAMFVSNCDAKWRTNYLSELMKHVHIKPRSTAWLFALKISLLLTIYQRNLVWFMHLEPSQWIGDLYRSNPGRQEITLSLIPVHLVQKSLLITWSGLTKMMTYSGTTWQSCTSSKVEQRWRKCVIILTTFAKSGKLWKESWVVSFLGVMYPSVSVVISW